MSSQKTSKMNQTGYDLWSATYDSDSNSTIAIDDLHFPKQWAHVSGKKVLEIGCGTGRHTIRLIDQGNEVVGIDFSRGMLEKAKLKLQSRRMTLIEGDFLHYAFEGQSFCRFESKLEEV
jgi:ubiquinone/menaquinone biosynthesis C-methylase UbiE